MVDESIKSEETTGPLPEQKYLALSGIPGVMDKVLGPFNYISRMPSKKIRDKLSECFNHWFQVPQETFQKIIDIGSILHNASLVIDDIEDGSDLRRGSPSAHMKYGIPLAINAGNFAYFIALRKTIELKSFEAVELFTGAAEAAHEGQGMEIYWRDTLTVENILKDVPSLEDYEELICKKTSSLFIASIEWLNIFSPKKKEEIPMNFCKIANCIGLYFQIRDDLMNITSDEYTDQKGFCEDITEGKLSYPVIYFLNQEKVEDEKKLKLFTILMEHTRETGLKREALEILKESGALDFTRQRLETLQMEIYNEITLLGGNSQLESVFENTLRLNAIKPIIKELIYQ